MLVCINGSFVTETEASVSVFDRSFLYGDGVFETMRVYNTRPFRFAQHFERLERGATFLKIALPFSCGEIERCAIELLERNHERDTMLRLQVSRGIGTRGYSPSSATRPIWVMSVHPAPAVDTNPPLWKLRTASWRLSSADPLAAFKTCNKLLQVLARAEAEANGADDAVFLNEHGHVTETTCSNLFWIANDTICTASLENGVLPGITRAVVLELCRALAIPTLETSAELPVVKQAQAVFLTLTSLQIVDVIRIDDAPIPRSACVEKLRTAFQQMTL